MATLLNALKSFWHRNWGKVLGALITVLGVIALILGAKGKAQFHLAAAGAAKRKGEIDALKVEHDAALARDQVKAQAIKDRIETRKREIEGLYKGAGLSDDEVVARMRKLQR